MVPNEQSEEFGGPNHARITFQGISIDNAKFMSDSLLENFRAEYEAIKQQIPDDRITTNMMELYKLLDYQKWGRYMDFIFYDNYTGNGESPALVALRHDLMYGAGVCEKYHGAVIRHVGTGNTRVFRKVSKLERELVALGGCSDWQQADEEGGGALRLE